MYQLELVIDLHSVASHTACAPEAGTGRPPSGLVRQDPQHGLPIQVTRAMDFLKHRR